MNLPKAVGIVGGGPGGLTLARLLQTQGIACTVFERDEHPLARPQGGSLDLHSDSGQAALREAGLEARFKALARYDDQYDAIYDEHGTRHFESRDTYDGDRPEIDRAQLRDLLLDSLPKETLRWNSHVSGVELGANGRYRVLSPEGVLGEFDLVVGADGAWSRVRPLVSPEKPAYLGVHCLEWHIDQLDTRHPALAALVPNGKITLVGRSRSLMVQRSSNSRVVVYAMFRVPEDPFPKSLVDVSSPERARAQLKALLPGWAPSLLAFIDAGTGPLVPRSIVALPVGHRWTHRPGVTLLGDAAHVMPPFSGEGVNIAMLDALELARQLARHSDWSQAVADYEEDMFERAQPFAEGARNGLDLISDDGLAHVLGHFNALQSPSGSAGQRTARQGTPQEMFETRIAEKTRNAATQKKVNAVYRFDLSGPHGGTWLVDFKQATAGVRREAGTGQCTIAMSDEDFLAMVAGEISPRKAFMTGKLKVKGDMMLAMKLGHVLEA